MRILHSESWRHLLYWLVLIQHKSSICIDSSPLRDLLLTTWFNSGFFYDDILKSSKVPCDIMFCKVNLSQFSIFTATPKFEAPNSITGSLVLSFRWLQAISPCVCFSCYYQYDDWSLWYSTTLILTEPSICEAYIHACITLHYTDWYSQSKFMG